MNDSRRDFLKKSMIGIAGLSVAPLECASFGRLRQAHQEGSVIRRNLGRTGYKATIVGMGVVENTDLLPMAYDSGINLIFTSGDYRNGMPEREIGRFFKDKPRDSFIIIDGVGHDRYIDPVTLKFKRNFKKKMISERLERSLKRLRLDYIDIFCLGNLAGKDTTLHDPFLEVLMDMKESGRIRCIGGSTHRNEPIVLKAASDSGIYDVIVTSYNFRMANRTAVKEAISYASGKGLGIVAMKTQAGVYWDRRRRNKINMKAALKWVLRDENVHSCVPAFSNMSEFEEDYSVMKNLDLTPAEARDLKIKETRAGDGLFCLQCGECLEQCRNPFDIPAVMRCYMYAFGHGNTFQAGETLRAMDLTSDPCEDCESCSVSCSMGFNIKQKLSDLSVLFVNP